MKYLAEKMEVCKVIMRQNEREKKKRRKEKETLCIRKEFEVEYLNKYCKSG